MKRREFLQAGTSAVSAAFVSSAFGSLFAGSAKAAETDEGFSHELVQKQAAALATKPFKASVAPIDEHWAGLTYDQYREIRVPETARIWGDPGMPFQVDLLPAGFLFKEGVRVNLVEDGKASEIVPTLDRFTFGPNIAVPEGIALPFSGFRIRTPINNPDVMDEAIVFQGASYFRAVGKNLHYGLSARGLALKTADMDGEEFPIFREFWIERPQSSDTTIVVHALLDSESTTGAYRFTVRPGEETIVDVELTLYPRVVLDRIGLAPLTSMFLFNATNRNRIEDFRNAVHDSSGLQIHNGRGEWIWRPLTNPLELQVSDFADASPHGFGLIQRTRAFTDFEDLEARYERRPSVWIEPIGDWGDGVVRLVEIPSFRETDDNIVAFWRPSRPIAAGAAFSTSYRMHWGAGPEAPQGLATVKATRVGRSFDQQRILVVVDFIGGPTAPDGIELDVSGSAIEVVHPVLQANPETGGLRASFEFSPVDVAMTELRMQLRTATGNASEVWLFRWTEQS